EDHDPSKWVSALKQGRSFVTNYPLIPEFSVNGVGSGGELKLCHPDTLVDVSLRVESILPIQFVRIIRNGDIEVEIPVETHFGETIVDTTVQIPLQESSWLALRVDGVTSLRHAAAPNLFAHTGAVYVELDTIPVRSRESAAHFLDWINDIETFVDTRDNWANPSDRFHVLQQLELGREYYREPFVIPSEPFNLLKPVEGDTLWTNYPQLFKWEESTDFEPFDQITYRVEVASDSLFEKAFPMLPTMETEQEIRINSMPGYPLWVRVVAIDRGNNQTYSIQDTVKIIMIATPAEVDDETDDDAIELPVRTHLKVWPNPANDQVWFRLLPPNAEPTRIEVVNVLGRRIATNHNQGASGSSIHRTGTNLFIWDGRDEAGRLVPSGHYWIRVLSSMDDVTGKQTVAPVLILR
ncbi:MAG: hypothetical protein KJ927_11150, partial [Candidatus Eisenbacteria bacterium]|nr:hypothetical protein [Candidatus Eisenbacteria bacterium]